MKILITESIYLNQIKESKRIYSRILKNLDKIKYLETDDRDVVDTTRGTMKLDGLKFNLKNINENYNLNLLFLKPLFKNQRQVFYFSSKLNALCFHIISEDAADYDDYKRYIRIRFKSWIEEDVFIHEFIHYLDSQRYSSTYKFNNPNDNSDYYNSPEELNVYISEIIYKLSKNKNLFDLSFNDFLKRAYSIHPAFIKNLNEKNKKKIINKLYTFYNNNKINEANSFNDEFIDIDKIKIMNELVVVDPNDINNIIAVFKSGKIPIDKKRCNHFINLIKKNNELPPLRLKNDFTLIDGYHRYCAYKTLNIKKVKFTIE